MTLFGSLGSAGGEHPPAKAPAPEKSANELAEERTSLAIDRTLMAADRSLMAWIRTALSMISFGFTIYKLLQGLAASGTQLANASSPRTMGLFLTGMGTMAMVFGTVEYWYRLQDLRRERELSLLRPSLIIAVLMSLIGLFLFVAIIFKVL
jgi:putative membrane protein